MAALVNNFSQLIKLTADIRFEIALSEILISLFTVGILVLILIATRNYIKKNRAIDHRLTQRLLKIHSVLSETTQSTVAGDTGSLKNAATVDSDTFNNPVPAAAVQSDMPDPAQSQPAGEKTTPKDDQPEEQPPVKVKKTRKMSMDERWADYEAKRAAQRKSA